MDIKTYSTKQTMGIAAAQKAAEILKDAIDKKGKATFVIATGASQFEFLESLVQIDSTDWSKTTMFHLDEYAGLPEDHPASFRKYLKERFISKVHPGNIYLIEGDAKNLEQECDRLNKIINQKEIDVSFVGIGENGHLAFNDPPADFDTEKSYIVVQLDEACRKQQLGEGWFKSLDDVPKKAISMSIKQIMKSKNIICTVPDRRKAEAVKNCFKGDEISPDYPASILKKHDNCFVFLDDQSSVYLK
jgi:glucosamine-6-phosphate deaminase